MDNLFIEVLITKRDSFLFQMLMILTAVFAVISFILIWFNPLFLGVCLICAVLAYYFRMHSVVEYEYSFVQRELTIDRILAKSKRKTMREFHLDQLEGAGAEGLAQLEHFNRENRKIQDYSDGKKEKKLVMYFAGKSKVLLNWDEELVSAMRSMAPGKFFLD